MEETVDDLRYYCSKSDSVKQLLSVENIRLQVENEELKEQLELARQDSKTILGLHGKLIAENEKLKEKIELYELEEKRRYFGETCESRLRVD